MGDNVVKRTLRNNLFTKNAYMQLKKLYHGVRRRKGMKIFISKGENTLIETQDIISELHNVKFFFAFGTLLGIIRDNNLIGRDMDIDINVFLQNKSKIIAFREHMEKNGYKRLHSFSIEEIGIVQDSFLHNEIMIDCHYIREKDDQCHNYLLYDTPDEKNKVLIFPFKSREIIKLEYKGKQINVPDNPEGFLCETYGETWNIPDAKYVYWENPVTLKTNYIGKVEMINSYIYT